MNRNLLRSQFRAWMKGRGNPSHDPLNGQFVSGGTSVSRHTMARLQEHAQARREQQERRQPASGVLILSEHTARQQGESVSDVLDVRNDKHLEMAASETGGSRVFGFASGDGSDLDKSVRFATNTNKDGKFERGALRVEISDPDTQKRSVHQRSMSELPKLVKQVLGKRYAPTSQHRRNSAYVMKADKWITVNGRHVNVGDKSSGDNVEVHRGYSGNDPISHTDMTFYTEKKEYAQRYGDKVTSLKIDKKDLFDPRKKEHREILEKINEYFSNKGDDKIYTDPENGLPLYADASTLKRVLRDMGHNFKGLVLSENAGVMGHGGVSYAVFKETMKAETRFITVGGRVIPIGTSQQQGQREQSQDKPKESEQNAGQELTHEQRTTIVNKLAAKMGIDAASIEMREEDESDENGTPLAHFDPDSGKIVVFPEAFSRGKQELVGTLAHEQSHANLSKVLGEFNKQRKQLQEGESLQNLEVYRELRPVFSEQNRATYQIAGGQSKYGQSFWDAYQAEPSPQNYVTAISESLAESQRLVAVGRGDEVHPQMMNLLNKVNNFARGLK